MRITISHNLLEQSANHAALIAEAFGHKPELPGDPRALALPHAGKAVRAWHEGDDFIVEYDDAIIVKALAIYVKIARFVAPIVRQCVAFAGELQADFDALKKLTQ